MANSHTSQKDRSKASNNPALRFKRLCVGLITVHGAEPPRRVSTRLVTLTTAFRRGLPSTEAFTKTHDLPSELQRRGAGREGPFSYGEIGQTTNAGELWFSSTAKLIQSFNNILNACCSLSRAKPEPTLDHRAQLHRSGASYHDAQARGRSLDSTINST